MSSKDINPKKNNSKLFRSFSSLAGFTLVELMTATSIGSVVLGTAGFGIVSMMNQSFVSAAKTQRQGELGRATDYIANDIKEARKVEASGNNLKITYPNNDTVTYSFNNISSSSSSVWVKPGIVTRQETIGGTAGPAQALVDGIIDRNPSSLPSCDPDGDGTSNLAGAGGFRFCVENSRLAKLYLFGNVTDSFKKELPEVAVDTLTYARTNSAATVNQYINVPALTNNGKIVLTQQATLTFRMIGGEFSCNGGNPPLSVLGTKFKYDDGTYANGGQEYATGQSFTLPPSGPGTAITVESTIKTENGCVPSAQRTRPSTNTTFVKALKDGDSIPANLGHGGQASVSTFLAGYKSGDKISLPPNQIIFLFEHYTNTSGSTYDLQDNIVLVTVE